MTKHEKGLMTLRPDSLSRLFHSRFDDFFDNFWKDFSIDASAFANLQPKSSFPKINVVETDTDYEVEIALAGFDKDDLSLEIKDNCLLIKADKKEESKNEDKRYLMKEISSRSFRRMVKFPIKIDTDKIDCSFENGIVNCTIGKEDVEKDDLVKIKID